MPLNIELTQSFVRISKLLTILLEVHNNYNWYDARYSEEDSILSKITKRENVHIYNIIQLLVYLIHFIRNLLQVILESATSTGSSRID